MSNRQRRRESSSTFFGVFPRCIFPRLLFLSLRPLHRARFFPSPFSPYDFPPAPIVSFSLRRTESSARVPPFSHHSPLVLWRKGGWREEEDRTERQARKRDAKVSRRWSGGSSTTCGTFFKNKRAGKRNHNDENDDDEDEDYGEEQPLMRLSVSLQAICLCSN